MAVKREILDLMSQLSKAGDDDRKMDLVAALGSVKMTYDFLVETKVGTTRMVALHLVNATSASAHFAHS